jgi:hypothetical protein
MKVFAFTYIDGLSRSIHGNSDRQKTDQAINDELEVKALASIALRLVN